MALLSQVEQILGRQVMPGLFSISPAVRCTHRGEKLYARGFRSEDSPNYPETLVLSKRDDNIGEWRHVPYQEVGIIAEGHKKETRSFHGHKIVRVAGVYIVDEGRGIPAKMAGSDSPCFVYGIKEAEGGRPAFFWVVTEKFDPKNEPRMIPQRDVVILD